MHIPDGFIDAPVALAAAGLATGAVVLSLRGARRELAEDSAPMAGLTAVFIFAAQMVNFPVGFGTSGHLIGAALAAILIGPYAAVLAMTVVLVVQALVFADGGLMALGLNLVNLAVVAVVVGWGVFRCAVLVQQRGGRSVSNRGVVVAAGAAGFFSVLAAAGAFVVEYLVGGAVPLPVGGMVAAMFGVHAVIGIGEALITALVISAVIRVRPDLIRGVRDVRRVVAARAPLASDRVVA